MDTRFVRLPLHSSSVSCSRGNLVDVVPKENCDAFTHPQCIPRPKLNWASLSAVAAPTCTQEMHKAYSSERTFRADHVHKRKIPPQRNFCSIKDLQWILFSFSSVFSESCFLSHLLVYARKYFFNSEHTEVHNESVFHFHCNTSPKLCPVHSYMQWWQCCSNCAKLL